MTQFNLSLRNQAARLGLLLILILALSGTSFAVAQTPTPVPDGPPPRGADRIAPEREPVIIESSQTPQGATNTIIALPAVADTYLASERPLQNFGGDALYLGYNLAGVDNFGAQRILVRFDVDPYVPDTAVINSATLRLNLSFSSPSDDVAMPTVVRRIASDWDEDIVTWNTEPTWTAVDSTANVGSAITYYEWPLTEVVQGWENDLYPNYGVEIIGDETVQQRERAFYSRETATELYPLLFVNYTTTDDATPPDTSVDDLPAYSKRNFTVSWSGSDPGGSGIAYYDVQVQINDGAWGNWLTGVTTTSAEYGDGEDGRKYAFRVRGVDNAGNVEAYGAADTSTVVDTLPPTVTVDPLPAIVNGTTFAVTWDGSDSASGIQYYDVQYRFNDGPWILWQAATTATSATFTGASEGVYAFEARGVDNLDHVEAFQDSPEATIAVDTEAPFIEPMLYLPIIFNE
ncbi:MAG: hypothetical protein CL608_20910 [Anaerolineaceae bacterium]|nr:hypothetical protein [Anaerolineaceae bacterium]